MSEQDLIDALECDEFVRDVANDLLAALKAMLDTHGKPHREEWINDAGFEHAKIVDEQARAAIAKAESTL